MSLKRKIKEFYASNSEVIEDIVIVSKNREVAYLLENNKFGQRPSIIENKGDIFSYIDKGAISFHISLERWSDPMLLENVKSRKELEEIRIGWDLIIDIDSKSVDIGKIVTRNIINFLENKGIKKIYLKYSGGKGFHIAIPWEIFPKRIDYLKKGEIVEEDTVKLFPDIARIIAMYLVEKIKEKVEDEILKKFPEIEKEKNEKELFFSVVEIDTIAISNRHLIRCLYSINEKTGRLSIPVDIKNLENFNPEYATLDNFIYEGIPFLTEEIKEREEAEKLFRDAINWKINKDLFSIEYIVKTVNKIETKKIEKELIKEKRKHREKITEDYFPPCIKNILSGIDDGRKRSVFILINFLYHIGWSYEEIEKKIKEWNNNLNDPLRERYVEYQLEWHKKIYNSKKYYLPPNCNNDMYYKEIGVCQPDNICKYIKNPLLYPYKKIKLSKDKTINSS
ncbi:MAG: DNA primase small subunit domain-containing protein [Nanopusillaceae archaeon]